MTYAELAPLSGLSGAPLALTAESTVRLQTDPDQGDDPATKAGAIVIPHHGEGLGMAANGVVTDGVVPIR